MADLTKFQIKCEEALRELLERYGRELVDRLIVNGSTATYLRCGVSGTDIYVYIYEDEAEFGRTPLDCRYETPDFKDDDGLINKMLGDLEAALNCSRYPND